MNDPLQVLCSASPCPDFTASAFGPFVVHAARDLDDVSVQLQHQPWDAVVLQSGGPDGAAAVQRWSGLSRAVLDSAVVVVAPEPVGADTVRLLRLGVQEVLPQREASAVRLAMSVRQAVERRRLEAARRKAYSTDLATGLPNHAQLMEHITHLLALREREPAAMALLALRIEGPAHVEARLGAEAANVLRRKVAVRLRAGLRASDVVAAVGADIFVVLLAWIDDQASAERVASKLAASLQRPFSVAGEEVEVAISVGLAQYPAHGKDAESLLRLALGAAAQRPAQGPNRAEGRVGRDGPRAANDESA